MESAEKPVEHKDDGSVIPESIRPGLERELELKRLEETLDAKYSADLDRKQKPPTVKNKNLPWIASASAFFIISGLTIFGPEFLAYLTFGGSSLFLGIEGFRHYKRKKIELNERAQAREKEEKRAIAIAASKGPAFSLEQIEPIFMGRKALGVSANCRVITLYDDLRVAVFNTGKESYTDDYIHFTAESYNFVKAFNTTHLGFIITTWNKIKNK